jgi:hypothetical protein
VLLVVVILQRPEAHRLAGRGEILDVCGSSSLA